jgi:hypothetical protein
MRNTILLLLPFVFCSCAQVSYDSLAAYQNIDNDLKAKGVGETVVNADLQAISDSIVAILHQNFSLDDTFVIEGDPTKGLYSVLVPTMKQSGFKVLSKSTGSSGNALVVNYTFTVTNNQLIETPDVALLRVWVGKTFQLSKAFTYAADGLQDKTGYCVIGGADNG